jgi:WD40 repeat protein
MPSKLSNLFSVLTFTSLLAANVFCRPVPQGNAQEAAPANRPAQAQVVLAPAPVQTGKLPPQEPLPADARKPDQLLRVGHTQPVQALAFSPDGKWLASGGYDKSIIVWNLSSGREEFHLGGLPVPPPPIDAPSQSLNKQAVNALAFNPDQTRLVSVEVSGAVKVWNLQTRKILFTIHPPRVHYYGGSIAYSADGKSLLVPVEKRATNATETAIGFFDAATGKSLRTIPTKWDFVSAVVPTKDGRLIAAGTVGADDDDDPSGSVQVFDLASGEAQKTYPVVVSAISPDGRWMTSFENTGIYHPVLWDLNDGKRIRDLSPKNASHVIFRPDGEEIAVTHGDSEAIDFVSTSSGEITKSFPGGGYGLGTAAYSADGKLLAAGSYSFGTIKVWDLASMKEKATLYGQSPVQSVTFSPDGKLLAATSGELRVWNVASGTEVVTLTAAPVNRAVFSADGKWLAANPGGQFAGYAVKIWNTNSWQEVADIPKEKGFTAFWLAFSDAKSAPPKIGNVQSLRLASGEESHTLWGSGPAMAISPNGKWLAQPAEGRTPTGAVDIWDAATGQKTQTIPAHRLAVIKLSFSRDGRWLVTVGQDNNPMMVQGQPGVMIGYPRVSVWDTASWNLQFSLEFPSSGAPGVDTSADGRLLAVSKGGGATQLFDLELKKPVAVLASPDAWPGNLAISPDSTVVVQGAREGIRLWRFPATKADSN